MQAQGSPAAWRQAGVTTLRSTTASLSNYTPRMLESVLSLEERLGRNIDQIPTLREPEYSFPTPGSPTKFAVVNSCELLDVFEYTDAAKAKVYVAEEGNLRDTEMDKWLGRVKQLNTVADHEKRPLSGGLRLLYGVCSFDEKTGCPVLPLTQPTFAQLDDKLCLPEQFIPILTGSAARAFTTSCSPAHGNSFQPTTCFTFRIGIYRPNYYQLTLSHSPTQNMTYGLLLAKTKDHSFPSLISTLKLRASLTTNHPLYLATLLVDLAVSSSSLRIQAADWRLNELEETMGQHEYVNRPVGDPLAIDFIATTRTLNTTNRLLGVERMRLGATILALEMIARETIRLDARRTTACGSMPITELAAYQMNACQNLVLRIEYAEKRVQSQIAVVYQFMAQKDSKVNISLAETSATIAQESKKDSSSMKAIAVLTMCFLPGTFLAAIFAMPIFDWDAVEGGPVVKSGFWWYWAIAVPLTVLVLGIWILALLLPWRRWSGQFTRKRRNTAVDIEAVKAEKIL